MPPELATSRPFYRRLGKRAFDAGFAVAMLLAFAPLIVVIAVMLRLKGVRSVIYSHERVGKGGRSFGCLKFRTMCDDADERLDRILSSDPKAREEWDRFRKLSGDPRIIPGIGRFLRSSSLDELPQILNVIRGEMSIVGPRPVTFEELGNYGQDVGYYLSVKPGLTGPWQIGGRSNKTFEERVAKDIWYVRNVSLKTDTLLLVRTAFSFLSGRLAGAQ